LLFASVGFGRNKDNTAGLALTARQVIDRMSQAYSTAQSYSDTGLVREVTPGPKNSSIKLITSFNTYFVRPDNYRFEWKAVGGDEPGWKVIWSNGGTFFSLNPGGQPVRETRTGRTIGSAAVVSRGASHTIAALLTTQISGFRITQIRHASLERNEVFEGDRCYVVKGFHPLGFPVELWISRSNFMLRKSREIGKDGRIQEEIRRSITVDRPILPSTFEFNPRKVIPKVVA
jgi:hypothetical protein